MRLRLPCGQFVGRRVEGVEYVDGDERCDPLARPDGHCVSHPVNVRAIPARGARGAPGRWGQIRPWASIASATSSKPAMFAPTT